MPTTLVEIYRQERKVVTGTYADTGNAFARQAPAKSALWQARAEIALRAAKDEGLIRFRWVSDETYEPGSGEEFWDERERAKLADGTYEALGCTVQVPKTCPHCHLPIEDNAAREDYWHNYNVDGECLPSLWGIVIDASDRYSYKREIERELACEAGVIDIPAVTY